MVCGTAPIILFNHTGAPSFKVPLLCTLKKFIYMAISNQPKNLADVLGKFQGNDIVNGGDTTSFEDAQPAKKKQIKQGNNHELKKCVQCGSVSAVNIIGSYL